MKTSEDMGIKKYTYEVDWLKMREEIDRMLKTEQLL